MMLQLLHRRLWRNSTFIQLLCQSTILFSLFLYRLLLRLQLYLQLLDLLSEFVPDIQQVFDLLSETQIFVSLLTGLLLDFVFLVVIVQLVSELFHSQLIYFVLQLQLLLSQSRDLVGLLFDFLVEIVDLVYHIFVVFLQALVLAIKSVDLGLAFLAEALEFLIHFLLYFPLKLALFLIGLFNQLS